MTHSHYDHFSGAGDVVNMCKERGWHEPQIFKKVDGNVWEERRMKSDLKGHMVNDLREGQNITLTHRPEGAMEADWLKILPIETPGHLSDHLCFELIESIGGKQFKSIFSGDHIIGEASTYF
mgnify:CR=1 FL=1